MPEIVTPATIVSPAVAFIDEAGEKGFARNLTSTRDADIGLMCALAVAGKDIHSVRSALEPAFRRFSEAAPAGEKIHITDAFRPGNEAWATVAIGVREEVFALVEKRQLSVIYDARRLRVQRETHERTETLVADARAAARSTIRVSHRPSDQRVETHLAQGIMIKLDALAEELGWPLVDLAFDEIDAALAKHYEEVRIDLGQLSASESTVKGWDPATRENVYGSIKISATSFAGLDVTRIGQIKVVGKGDPLVLAIDIIANSLHHHLRSLSDSSHLNAPSSINGWALESLVYGVRDDALEDLI